MGMTTRVRARLRTLHKMYRFDPQVREEKIAETVCLLSVLFLLPYCSKGHTPLLLSLGGWCLATYTCLVLPVLISANYKYPAKWLKKLINNIPGYIQISYEVLKRFFLGFCAEMSAMEHMFIKMTHIYSFICQLFFLTLCEVAIIRSKLPAEKKDEKLITGLTTLLFYSVFGYFVNRLKDIYLSDWNRPRRTNNMYRDYSQWLFKIAIEWAKAIIIIICLREQGMNYHPDLFFNIVTFTYYLCTEKIFCEIIEGFVTILGFDSLDALEYLYVPIVLRTYTAVSSAILIISLLHTQYARYALLSAYFLLYLNIKDLISNYIYPLILEKQTFASFRTASIKDIEDWDDICAVCLTTMSKARITPCNHLFHPQCLKRCLKNSFQCPLCKQNFLE